MTRLLEERKMGIPRRSALTYSRSAKVEPVDETPSWMVNLSKKIRSQGGYTVAKPRSYGSKVDPSEEIRTNDDYIPEWVSRRTQAKEEQPETFIDPRDYRPSMIARLAPWQEEVGARSRERIRQEYVRAQPVLGTSLPVAEGSYYDHGRTSVQFVDVGNLKDYSTVDSQSIKEHPDQFLAPLEQYPQLHELDYSGDYRGSDIYGDDEDYYGKTE